MMLAVQINSELFAQLCANKADQTVLGGQTVQVYTI